MLVGDTANGKAAIIVGIIGISDKSCGNAELVGAGTAIICTSPVISGTICV